MYAGWPFTVALIPPRSVGMRPDANSGAVLQITPDAGVVAGTRLIPWISTQPLGDTPATFGGTPTVLTDVIRPEDDNDANESMASAGGEPPPETVATRETVWPATAPVWMRTV